MPYGNHTVPRTRFRFCGPGRCERPGRGHSCHRVILLGLVLFAPGCRLISEPSETPMGTGGFIGQLFGTADERDRDGWRMVSKPFGDLQRRQRSITRDVFRFTVYFVDRPPMTPAEAEGIWGAADLIGTMTADRRAALRRAGLAVGHSGRQLPPALDRLLRPRAGIGLLAHCREQTVTLLEGGETELQVSPMLAEAELTLPGEREPRRFQTVRFVIRVRARRVQNDWVRLTLVPEVHHGPITQRHVPDEHGNWRIVTSQSIVSLTALGVQTDLTPGEHLILGRRAAAESDLGSWFFASSDAHGPAATERLVVLRLDSVDALKPALRE